MSAGAVRRYEAAHCMDCCCAQSWKALGVTTYTGLSIVEHIKQLIAERAALHAQAVALAREVERIKGNGSPCTDFGRGVIAACEDIETFIKQQAQALLEGR